MNRLTIKLMIAIMAIITTVSITNHAEAQTPSPQSFATSSGYITGASGRYYITPFAGFGVSMLPDSCSSYANIASDTTKITYLLTTQIKDMMTMYNNASCNTETTPSPTCTSYIDTINNLAISYATYQVEGMKQAKEKTSICNADNTRKPNVYKKTYYGIDIVALTYASVRDAYVNKKFTDYTTLINNVKTNLTNKLNAAITADKFVDVTPSSANLRTLAQSTFKTTTKVITPRSRIVPPPASTVLSMPNAFLFFGQTNNVSDKTIGAIPMNSLQEYINTFNANRTRFGDIYSSTNRPLLDAGSTILININRQIDLRLPPRETTPVPINTPPIVQQQPPTQKASVINSISNWFGGIWTAISDFFGYMFWGERAGAKVAATTTPAVSSGTGASGSGPYPTACPALPNPVPKPSLSLIESAAEVNKYLNSGAWNIEIGNGLQLIGDIEVSDGLDNVVIFNNLFVMSPKIEKVVAEIYVNTASPKPVLTADEYRFMRNMYYGYDSLKTVGGVETFVDAKKLTNSEIDSRLAKPGEVEKVSIIRELTRPSSPYNCLRNFIATHLWYYDWFFSFSKIYLKVTALDQTAVNSFDTKSMRKSALDDSGPYYEEVANDIDLKKFNDKNKR